MQTHFSLRGLAVASLAVLSLSLSSCNNDDELEQAPVSQAPDSYNFQNVNYSGQTVRLLLLKDLEAEMEKAANQPVAKADLIKIFRNTENRYTDLSTGKMLSDKMATPQDLQQVEAWFEEIEALSNRPQHGYVTDEGVDLKQMVAKTIMGSVFYYRALNDYLNVAQLTADDNNTVTAGTGTVMEHHFDEGFGYFGAARNLNMYSDAEIISPGKKDINGDGTFDPKSEVNYYYAQTAAKRDVDFLKFTSSPTDFTADVFKAMVRGRYYVTQKQYTLRNQEVEKARAAWDKMLAATTIHYAEQVKSDLNGMSSQPTAAQLADLAKHWSEMKAYFNMIKYNPDNKLGTAAIDAINANLGTNSATVSVSGIESAVASLKTAYNF